MSLRVYIAASSSELERVDRATKLLTDAGIEVVSTWPENIRRVGEANPRTASREQRYEWADRCLREVGLADIVWILVPSISTWLMVQSRSTIGAWYEICYAMTQGICVISSGDTRQSIFCAMTEEFSNDDEAFEEIKGRR